MDNSRARPQLALAVTLLSIVLAACGGPGNGGNNGDAGRDGTYVPPIPIRDGGDPVLDPDAACATQTSEATRGPVNLLLLLDRSGSMAQNGKWTAAVRAITSLTMSLPQETRVGLVLFPSPSGDPNSPATYAMPEVPIGPLSSTGQMIRSALMRASPGGRTPMSCSLTGVINYLATGFTMDGSRNVVLITDGAPNDCGTSSSMQAQMQVLAAAGTGPGRTPPIRTFVVGTPEAGDAFLSAVAVAGGTPDNAPVCMSMNNCHYSLRDTSFEMDLARAFNAIAGRVASCEFRLSVDSTRADPNLLNVRWTPASGGASRVIPRDPSHMNGWDYSADRTNVILYGGICDEVRMNTTAGRVDILFGCPTLGPG